MSGEDGKTCKEMLENEVGEDVEQDVIKLNENIAKAESRITIEDVVECEDKEKLSLHEINR